MAAEKILIIEDDPAASEAVATKMSAAGFRVVVARTGAAGLAAYELETPNLVVLDLMLPDADGVELCRVIRQTSDIPIIMLTARAEEAARIVGLEVGADDYVTKPFSPKELLARIRAVLRRTGRREAPPSSGTKVHQAADIVLDEARYEVFLQGRSLRLTPTEYKLLTLLMRNAGHVVPRLALVEHVWGYDGFSYNLVEIHIGNLRRKIEDDPRHPRRLITVRAFGYKIVTDTLQE
jgi:DNA-binding response OmpR family regulator